LVKVPPLALAVLLATSLLLGPELAGLQWELAQIHGHQAQLMSGTVLQSYEQYRELQMQTSFAPRQGMPLKSGMGQLLEQAIL
jgi:hypothetical protein